MKLEYLAKGWRGVIFRSGKYVVKVDKRGLGSIKREGKWLKKLNKCGIGPKLKTYGENFLIYEFVKGVEIRKKFNKKVALNVLKQCYKLDKLRIDKFEMHHPFKHVLIGKNIVMIDFERCKFSEKPKNVTQFCQFLSRKMNKKIPKRILQDYKKDYSLKNFKKILKYYNVL